MQLSGYTGYAELRAATSYDMFLNLSTTRTDGGWMYFKINNDDFIQLSGSDNKINIYKDAIVSGKLGIGGIASPCDSLHIKGAIRIEPTSHSVFVFYHSPNTDFGSNSYSINAYVRNGDGNSNLKFYNSRSGSNYNVVIDGDLDVGVDASSSNIDAHCDQQGYTAVTELHSQSPWISKFGLITTHPTPRSFIFLKGSIYFEFNANNKRLYIINH